MKVVEKQKTRTEIYYECETCEKIYGWEDDALKCEKVHACDHTEVEYILEDDGGDSNFNVIAIEKTCKACRKVIDDVLLEPIEDNQKLLKQVYDLLINHNSNG